MEVIEIPDSIMQSSRTNATFMKAVVSERYCSFLWLFRGHKFWFCSIGLHEMSGVNFFYRITSWGTDLCAKCK